MTNQDRQNQTIKSLFAGKLGSRYFGKHVVIVGNQVYLLPLDGVEARRFVDDLKREHPGQETELVFIPRPETYIL